MNITTAPSDAHLIAFDTCGNPYRVKRFYKNVEEFKNQNNITDMLDILSSMNAYDGKMIETVIKNKQLISYKDVDNDSLCIAIGTFVTYYEADECFIGWLINYYDDYEIFVSESEVDYVFDVVKLIEQDKND